MESPRRVKRGVVVMSDQTDLNWVVPAFAELNTMLQQILRYADLARQHEGESKYVDLVGERVEVASRTAQSFFDKVTAQTAAQQVTVQSKVFGSALRKPAPPPPAAIPAQIQILNEKGDRELILVVEDEAEIADLAGVMLTDEGYRVILAHDGFEALNIYQQISTKVRLVILDYFLPVMDGDAVFDELCLLNPNVAVVLSSGFGEQNKLGSMLARGLRGFIPKPYTREKLLVQVRSILDVTRDSVPVS